MRLRACLGLLLFATGGCAQIPGVVRIEVDGSTLEFKKNPAPPAPTPTPVPPVPDQPAPPVEPTSPPDAGSR